MIERNIIENNILFIIPSWGNLLGYPTLGKYANHSVSKISQDLVIFFGGAECAIPTEKGIFYYLFGLGYHYLKFELQTGRYITDNRHLTGLILADFVYDHLATSKNITLEDDRDVIIGEKLFKLPIDLSFKSENKRTFIQGTLMRNLFIPYKDIFLELMETIRNPESFQVQRNGHMLLSTYWNFYNKILVSSEMDYEMKTKYLSSTAGLDGIILGAKKHIEDYLSESNQIHINKIITNLKSTYSTIEYDPMYLFSIIENASRLLRIGKKISLPKEEVSSSKSMPKESVFVSAENYMDFFTDWPEKYKRQTKEQLEKSAIHEKTPLYQPKDKEKIKKPVDLFQKEEKKFEIRTMKRPIVEFKPLPRIPTSNAIEILLVLKNIIRENYDLHSLGKAFEIARDYIKSMVLHSNYLWDMSKYANLFQRAEPNLGLSSKEQLELLEEVGNWIVITRKKNSTI